VLGEPNNSAIIALIIAMLGQPNNEPVFSVTLMPRRVDMWGGAWGGAHLCLSLLLLQRVQSRLAKSQHTPHPLKSLGPYGVTLYHYNIL
jgi:hypothetical protein